MSPTGFEPAIPASKKAAAEPQGLNPGFCGDRPETNRLCHGTNTVLLLSVSVHTPAMSSGIM